MTPPPVSFGASVFESFNARPLAPEQVAKTFVTSEAFEELIRRSHSTVIGPRGSGKTSLLKMLQPRALESWASNESDAIRARVDYTGVYIPTDISWNLQTSAILDKVPDGLVKAFRSAAFTTHVLHELVDAFCWRVSDIPANGGFRRVGMTIQDQRAVAKALALAWGLKPATESLIGIKHALSARLAEIWAIAQNFSLVGSAAVGLPAWVSHDLLSQCSYAIEVFDDAAHEQDGRWALLFDELELTPDWILTGLLTALRSTNQKLIYKLALSPFNETYETLKSSLQAAPDEDYKEIRLWYAHKEAGMDFSRKLMLSVLDDSGISVKTLSEFLGRSILEVGEQGEKAYDRRSPQYRILKHAFDTDPSFKKYCQRVGIDLEELASLPESERAAKVRKVYPIVAVRDFFRSESALEAKGRPAYRGRKSLEIYAGELGILAVSEGNPRWIIGITKALIHEVQSKGRGNQVPRDVQSRLLEKTIHKFRARLKTVSIPQKSPLPKAGTLLSFLDQIGDHLGGQLILAQFEPEPILSFIVDSSATVEVRTAIGRALNAGAIVFVPDKVSVGLINDVRGKRFRLSYLLAPYYAMPLRLGDPMSLTRILSDSASAHQKELKLE